MKPINQMTTKEIVDFLKSVDKKTWIKVGAIAAAALVVFMVIIWPAWFKRVQVHMEIKNVEAKIQSLNTLRGKKEEWLKNKDLYNQNILDVKNKLYKPGESALLLGEISKLANESKISIVASRPKDEPLKYPPPFDQQYLANLYDFSVEGGYHQLGQFVANLESFPKLLRIQEFHIVPRENNPQSHTADIQLSAIALKTAAPAAPTAAK